MRHSSFSSRRPRSLASRSCSGWDLRTYFSIHPSLDFATQPRLVYLPRTKLPIQAHDCRNRALRLFLAYALHSESDYKPHAPRLLVLRRDAGRHHVRVPARQPLLLLAPRPQVLQDPGLVHPQVVLQQDLRNARLVPNAGQPRQRLQGVQWILPETAAEGQQEEGGRRGGDDRLQPNEVYGHGFHRVFVGGLRHKMHIGRGGDMGRAVLVL